MSLAATKQSTQYYIDRLRMRIAELSLIQYPGNHPGPKKWNNLIAGMLDTAEKYLQNTDSVDEVEHKRIISDALSLAKQAYNYLSFIPGTDVNDLAHAAVKPLQRWFELFEIENTIIFHVERSAIYELYEVPRADLDAIRDPSPSLQSAIDKIEWPLFRVTVPSRELGILPHLAIVAHEVGHALIPRISFDLAAFSEAESSLNDSVSRETRLGEDVPWTTWLKRVKDAWIKELASDAIGLLVAGPAFFFALSEFFQQAHGGYGLSETHPPFDLRRNALYIKLCEGSPSFASEYLKYASQTLNLDVSSPLIVSTPAPSAIAKDVRHDMLFEAERDSGKVAVLAHLPTYFTIIAPHIFEQTRSFLQEKYPQCIYTVGQFSSDLSEHLDAMLAAIPPIEKGRLLINKQPTDFTAILNIGWVTLLSKINELRIKDEQPSKFGAQKAEGLHNLLIKAVELSETRRLWSGL